ncbi:cytochrome P450 [Microdochium trichocladiopsis]|uniref:Cytochrome P450 n=1 Tax=Microdochium trichocladiopsis TaxID=1682393 RepID=A0A9P9BIL9_9PEZI|nr:cytochrome P450 [Microdochium trichocladiopsis]KAH7014523.1 cytochrome P450 [Microdochium trichocladiopsis]
MISTDSSAMTAISAFILAPNVLITAALLVAGNAVFFLLSRRPKGFPPGPPGLPGLGNLYQINKSIPALTYSAWALKYGQDKPMGVKLGSTNIVVLNSARMVRDLFERRGAIYSDRPRPNGEDEKWKFQTHQVPASLFHDSGPWLTRWRKEFNGALGSAAAVARLHPMNDAETARVLVALLEAGPAARRADLEDMILSWVTSVPCIAVVGRRPDAMAHHGFEMDVFRRRTAGYMMLHKPDLMDRIPVLRHLPGKFGMARWRAKSQAVAKEVFEIKDQFLSAAKEHRAALDAAAAAGKGLNNNNNGTEGLYESLGAKMLREQRENRDKDVWTDLGLSAWNIVAAAMYTSLATFSTMLMIVAKYPEVQQRIREEVLQVSGGDGAPLKSTDVARLMYTEAFWHEVNRWRPVAPQGIPHAPAQEDVYDGYQIPKHTAVYANVWHIHHSPEDYESPEKFDPERFLRHPFGMRPGAAHDPTTMDASAGSATASARATYSFGFGRRVCPGMLLAKQSLMLGLAKILWAFDVLPAQAGEELDLNVETGFVQGLITFHPKHLDVSLKLRPGRSKQDILDHYSETYKVEAELMGW